MEFLLWAIIIGIIFGIIGGILQVLVNRNKDNKKKQESASLIAAHGMTVTKELGDLIIDDVNKKWTIKGYPLIYSYSDIVDISETQNGIKTRISGGIVGGLTNGSVGIGLSSGRSVKTTISSWTIDITVRNAQYPLAQIVLLAGTTIKVGDFAYNATNLLREKYIAQLKQMQDAGSRTVTPTPTFTSNSIINTKVVGVTKENDKGIPIQTILPMVSADSDLLLVREKGNPFDANAVKVLADHQHIGYLKSSIAQQVAPMMDQGKIIDVELSEVTGGGDKYYGCNIKITL